MIFFSKYDFTFYNFNWNCVLKHDFKESVYKICNSKCVTRFSLIQIYNSAKIKTIELIPCIVGSDSAHRSSNAYCDIIIKKYTRSYEGNSNLFDYQH